MPILGLRDTTSYEADRFQNWRRTILYAFPHGSAPLTALLSLMKSEPTNDPTFHWFEKSLATQRSTLTAAYTAVATSIAVADSNFRVGHIIMNELTNEIMEVVGVSSNGLTLTVVRGKWGAAAASVGANDGIVVVGNIAAEGDHTPESISIDPTAKFNVTQIFRTPWRVTGTALNTSLKWDAKGPYKELMREALNFHSIEMEKAFIFGKRAQYVDPSTGNSKRTTGGILEFLPSAHKIALVNDLIYPKLLTELLELLFRVTSNKGNEKLALVGSGALSALNLLAQEVGMVNLVPAADAFGLEIMKWHTPHGTVYLKQHPLFTQHPVWRYSALFLDVHNLKYRYLNGRDTTRLTNRQNPGDDFRMDEFLTESGLEVHHPESHMWVTGIKNASTTTP